ncbi:MAG TPA: FtsX-like permease family protein [Galbitalea sp.]|jgi:predicted lysophospholipase L1 biosynthesis ABC-type transport system permease subunit|nr:FtsX-like permease family protein [Galbitalea sp.]
MQVTNDGVRGGALRLWPIRVAGGRFLRQWRLLLLVVSVAIIASTVVTSVGLLITATESSAVRTALRAIPASQRELTVNVEQPSIPISRAKTVIGASIASVLGTASNPRPTVRAYTSQELVTLPRGAHGLTYLGELDGTRSHAKLVSGQWASTAPPEGSDAVDVDLPALAASRLRLGVGATVAIPFPVGVVTARVVGIYSITDPHSDYWSQDPLRAAGNSNLFVVSLPDNASTPVDAFGPLLVAPGSVDAVGVTSDRLELDYLPTFTSVSPDELSGLINRLQGASNTVPAQVGDIGGQLTFSGNAIAPIGQIASALVVTRSGVVVITLLLLILAVAALAQAARLFNDARSGDRQLMRARGASRGQILGMAALEAGAIGVITAATSAPLARLVYAIVALQPAMRAADMPRDAGMPLSAWETGAALGAVFVIVLVISVLASPIGFVAAEQQKSRQRRATGLLRSGLDLGVVVLAGVAFWQLVIYKSPVGATATISVDPVLVAAPALVLLAGTLLCARLIPLVARAADGLSGRSRGVMLPLAGWEVGRRSRRVAAVVLLLTLALSVGAFSQTFLATWHQSQLDQAVFAVGPPVRVPADPTEAGSQQSLLRAGAVGEPQPGIRRVADVLTNGEQDQEDATAVVLGLTAQSRALLQRGRENSDGGAVIARALRTTEAPLGAIVLPGKVQGITADARVGTPGEPLAGVSADLVAVVQDGAGVLQTIDLGTVPVDGLTHPVAGTLSALPKGGHLALPLKLVGLQASVFMSNPARYVPNADLSTDILVGGIAVTDVGKTGTTAVTATVPNDRRWHAQGTVMQVAPTSVAGWQLGLNVGIPANVRANPASYSLVAWAPDNVIPAVFSSALATQLNAIVGDHLFLQFDTASVGIEVAAITPLIPGAADSSLLTAASAAGADSSPTPAVVVDQTLLERALVQGGESGSIVDEWWVDVPPGRGQAYVTRHPALHGGDAARSSEVLGLDMQQDPLRVATQAALWLAIGAAALLAAIGFAVHSASTMAARRVEFAQLRAIGLSRRRLVGLVAVESLLLGILGVVFGLGVGVLLGVMSGPLIALSPNGTPAVPPVIVSVPWLDIGALVLVVAVVLVAIVVVVARAQKFANPATILREADNG